MYFTEAIYAEFSEQFKHIELDGCDVTPAWGRGTDP